MPFLVFVAGPNGSGKSTAVARGFLQGLLQTPEDEPLIRVNPDDILREISQDRPGIARRTLELDAAIEADQRLRNAISAGRSVMRETVLSSDRLLSDVVDAKAKGYQFALFYILLRNPDLNVARVALRVAQNGHPVPEDRIRARWSRSLDLLPVFAAQADMLIVADNSGSPSSSSAAMGPAVLIEATSSSYYIAPEARMLSKPQDDTPAELGAAIARVIALLEP